MRRLMLLRHAKALRAEGLRDFDRPLKSVGREQARSIGQFMAARRLEPGFALVSTALRARETFDLVDIFLHPPPDRADEPLIYEATAESLFDIVRRLPARQPSALLVGHNPAFEEIANELIATGEKAALSHFGGRMPTAALAVIDFEADRWKEVETRSGALAVFATPALVEAEK
ncbi:MAG TPA: histidine phosphatase family protein [Xanthobacteraceae bacterium]|nr:histidine phosphatase family protein [Xanthobacteraceae bacterium]